jgi:hypothetical protein
MIRKSGARQVHCTDSQASSVRLLFAMLFEWQNGARLQSRTVKGSDIVSTSTPPVPMTQRISISPMFAATQAAVYLYRQPRPL